MVLKAERAISIFGGKLWLSLLGHTNTPLQEVPAKAFRRHAKALAIPVVVLAHWTGTMHCAVADQPSTDVSELLFDLL